MSRANVELDCLNCPWRRVGPSPCDRVAAWIHGLRHEVVRVERGRHRR